MSVTGRFLGFCLAAILAPAAVCGVPAGIVPAGYTLRVLDSDIPATSTGPGLERALHPRGGRAGDPGLETHDCDLQHLHGLSSDARTSVELQLPMLKPVSSGDVDSQGSGSHTPGDGVRRNLGARSAVLDSDKADLGMSPAPADDRPVNLKVRPLNDRERYLFGVPEGGLVVTAVGQGAAQQAGFRQGDVVLMLDGISLTSSSQFYQLIRQRPHDRPVPVLVRRPTSDLFLPLGTTRR
ncbi:MAG TPA: PDZ domain-containing protein [Gammaproteobacteria bacterium]|nr:PDZ domain-containing protein [Gammaproteobacteria bacterium]